MRLDQLDKEIRDIRNRTTVKEIRLNTQDFNELEKSLLPLRHGKAPVLVELYGLAVCSSDNLPRGSIYFYTGENFPWLFRKIDE